MAGMCCGVVGETKTPSTIETNGGRQGRRRRMEIQQLKFLAAAASDVVMPLHENNSNSKRRKIETTVVLDSGLYDDVLDTETCRFGLTVVCGRRRDLEDAVAVKPSFSNDLHFYGVYDGHGCSHVTT